MLAGLLLLAKSTLVTQHVMQMACTFLTCSQGALWLHVQQLQPLQQSGSGWLLLLLTSWTSAFCSGVTQLVLLLHEQRRLSVLR